MENNNYENEVTKSRYKGEIVTIKKDGKVLSFEATGDYQYDCALYIQVYNAIDYLDWKYGSTNFKNKTIDCSGLTAQLYNVVGTTIPSTSRGSEDKFGVVTDYGQYNAINKNEIYSNDTDDIINWDNIPAGSIITWGKNGGHVAYYLGNGYILHALNEKRNIIVSPIYDLRNDPSIKNVDGKYYTPEGMLIETTTSYLSSTWEPRPLTHITTFDFNTYVDSDGNINMPVKIGEDKYVPISETNGEIIYSKYNDSTGKNEHCYIIKDDEGQKVPELLSPDINPDLIKIINQLKDIVGEKFSLNTFIKIRDLLLSILDGEINFDTSTLNETLKLENDNLIQLNTKQQTAKEIAELSTVLAVAERDPLILDLDNDGFGILKKTEGTNFDLDKNGFAEKINWTSTDGFLCLDLNENGKIDNGGELFGDNTTMPDGSNATGGFNALTQYDTNNDGVIDQNDEVFGKLRVWVDADGNGESSEGELKSLEELGIVSISVNPQQVVENTGTEATIRNRAVFTKVDGTTLDIAELWVSADMFDTVEFGEYVTDILAA
jgi:hypothetical protein